MAAASSSSSFTLAVMPVLCKFFIWWSVMNLEQGGEMQHQAEKSEFAPPHTYSTAKDSLTSSASLSTELLCPLPSLSLREHPLLVEGPWLCPSQSLAMWSQLSSVLFDAFLRTRTHAPEGFPCWSRGPWTAFRFIHTKIREIFRNRLWEM